jgi:hypothetical protein
MAVLFIDDNFAMIEFEMYNIFYLLSSKQDGEVPVGGKQYIMVLNEPGNEPSNVQVKICRHVTTGNVLTYTDTG